MDPAERIIRRVLWAFVAVLGIPMFAVILSGVNWRQSPKFFSEMPIECSAFIAGPPLFWTSFLVIYFRASKAARRISMGRLGGVAYFGSIAEFFRLYRKERGLDFVIWIMLLSGTWSVVILWLAGWDYSKRQEGFLLWLIFISSLWLLFAGWLIFLSGERASRPQSPDVPSGDR